MDKVCTFTEEELNIFREPARILVAGFSGAGKSSLVERLCKKYAGSFARIIISSLDDKTHPLKQITSLSEKIILVKGLINPADYQNPLETDNSSLYIIDDLFNEAVKSDVIANIFTRGRHEQISVILISQNLFPQGKYARTITLNCSQYILLRQRDLSQLECLGRQIYGKNLAPKFVEIYRHVTADKYGYLLVDLTAPEEIQLRSFITGEGNCETVYRW